MGTKVTRLYEQFQPEHYALDLDIDLEAMSFKGQVRIDGKKTGRPAQRLTFHQKDLKITTASITKHDKKGDQPIEVDRINNQNSFDEVRLHSNGMIYPGDYTVTLEFEGQISDQMHGIYPCYFKHDGKDKKLIASQFESHHAREAFPCIDEPEAKATFDLSLTTPANLVVLGNTPIKNQTGQTTTFETSPRMSTYLLAFVIGEMHSVEAKSKNGTLVRSWATVAQNKMHLNYANTEAVKALEFFEDYFETPFPLPKIDQVALPDFDSLAMENWGLITFREVGLLSDPKNRSLSGEQLITLVICHEMSHQWFGNLVTMRWWDDLWLNESFASIMETLAPDRLHPGWQIWEEFLTGRVIGASNRDIYKDVQSVGVNVQHPDEINSLFDPAIVYAKGARLLKMLYDYIGEDAFRAGLKNYFKKYAYKNTSRSDLWSEFSGASGQDIEALMTPWLQQSGTPQLNVKRSGNKLELSQQRFLLDGEDKTSLWPIPLLANAALQPNLLKDKAGSATFSQTDIPVLNVNGSGHFITKYEDDRVLQELKRKIANQEIDAINRISLLNDMLLLTRHGDYALTELLDLASHCQNEPRDAVWSMLARAIGYAQTLTDGDTKTEQRIRSFKRRLAADLYEKLGWTDRPDDDPNTKHLRTTVLALSVAGEAEDALNTAHQMFAKAGSVEKLPAEQRALVAGVAVRFGQAEVVDQLMAEYTDTVNADVQESIAAALSSTRNPKVASKVIKWGLTEGGAVRQQDLAHWFAYMIRNHYTRQQIWQWLIDDWERLARLFGGGKHMDYFVWYAAGPLSTPDWQVKFNQFFEPMLNDISLKRNILVGQSEITARVAWRQREEANLVAYFQKSAK